MFTVIGSFKFDKEAEAKSIAMIIEASKYVSNEYKIDFDNRDAHEHLGKVTSVRVSREQWNQTSVHVFSSILHATSGVMALAMFDAGVRAHGYVTQFDFDKPEVLSMSHPGADIRCLVDPFTVGETLFNMKWNPMWCPFVGPAKRLWWSGYKLSLFQDEIAADRQAVTERQISQTETLASLFCVREQLICLRRVTRAIHGKALPASFSIMFPNYF